MKYNQEKSFKNEIKFNSTQKQNVMLIILIVKIKLTNFCLKFNQKQNLISKTFKNNQKKSMDKIFFNPFIRHLILNLRYRIHKFLRKKYIDN